MSDNNFQPSSGEEWRKPREEGLLVELPSGKIARVRPVGADTILMSGHLPDNVTQAVIDIVMGEQKEVEVTAERAQQLMGLWNAVCKTCFVIPKVVDEPAAKDEISIDDITMEDKIFVTQLLNAPATEIAKFHPRKPETVEEPPLAVVDASTGRKQSSKPTAGNKAVGE